MIRQLFERLPWRWRTTAVRAVAVVFTVLAWLVAVALFDRFDAFDSPLLAIGLLFPLAWLKPWTRLARRFGQPLVPWHAAVPLLSPTITHLRQRDLLCRALAWSAAVSLATLAMTKVSEPLQRALLFTPLEGSATFLSVALALLALAVGGWMHGLPARWARARMAGEVPGWVVSDALSLGANLMAVLGLLGAMNLALPALILDVFPRSFSLLGAVPGAAAWWLYHSTMLRRLAPFATVSEPLWLAVLPGTGGSTDAAARNDLRTLLAWAHQFAGLWRIGPVTVLLPASAPAGGEHLHAAETAGVRGVLFPTMPVQWADWQRHLPPAPRWSALPLRELHLPDGALLGAVRELMPAGARLVVLAAPGAEADLAGWQALLRDRPAALCRTSGAAATADTVVRDEMRPAVLQAAARRVLEPLRPQAVQAVADSTDAPAEAMLPAVALPGLIHPGRFALAAGATLAATLLVLAWMAFDLKQASDEVVAAIRSIEPAVFAPAPAAAASASAK